ncbi:MAG: hypothetical protein PHD04_01965 [Candidatus Pacebacteria bacterium]|nr:hypothetical protein [Candidatus Paceibacterota bacterium]
MSFTQPHFEHVFGGHESIKTFEMTGEELELLKEEVSNLARAAERKASDISRDLNEGGAANLSKAQDESRELQKKIRLFHSITNKLREDTDHSTPIVH